MDYRRNDDLLDASDSSDGSRSIFRTPVFWAVFGPLLVGSVMMAALLLLHMPNWLYEILPMIPHHLEFITVEVNEERRTCKKDETCLVRPSDKLKIIAVTTDGFISKGLTLYSPDLDVKKLTGGKKSIVELLPQMDFDEPKSVKIEVFWTKQLLGSVTFNVRWTFSDWLEKAEVAELPEKKLYCLQKALQENPDHVLTRNRMANLYVAQKKYIEAAQQYEIILHKSYSRIFLERLVNAYVLSGNRAKAIETYVDLISKFPDKIYVKHFIDYMKKSMTVKEIVKTVEVYSAHMPEGVRSTLWVFVSDVCSEAKEWDCVAEYSEKAWKSSARTPTLAYNTAVALYQKKEYQKAADYLKKYISEYPSDVEAQKMLALCYENLKNWNDAEEVYRKMVESGKGSGDIISRWIGTVEHLNDPSRLMIAYQKFTQMKPNDPLVWYNLGVLYAKHGKKEEAKKAFEKVVQLKPTDVTALKYLKEYYHNAKNQEGERDILKKLMSVEPGTLEYYNDYFTLSDKNKNIDETIKILTVCTEKIPKAVSCYENLLLLYLKHKKEKEAIKVLEKLIDLQSNKPELLLQLAKLYYSQKNYEAATLKLKLYLEKKPDDEAAEDLYLECRKKLAVERGEVPKKTKEKTDKGSKTQK